MKVDLATHKTETGEDYLKINPRGYVPALQVGGEVHTEVAALVQYLAEQAPQSNLLPAAGTLERFRVNQWLAFVSQELHKTFSPWLLDAKTAESTKQVARDKLAARFAELDALFATRPYLAGDAFTVRTPTPSRSSTGRISSRSTSSLIRISRRTWRASPRGQRCAKRWGPNGSSLQRREARSHEPRARQPSARGVD